MSLPRVNPRLVRTEQVTNATKFVAPAPIGGLNTRDSLSTMPDIDAIELTNMFPDVGSVITRKGYTSHTTSYPSQIETILEFNNGTSTTMVTASSDKVYTNSLTSGGSPTQIGSGFTNARWQGVNFNGRLLLVNGEDNPQNYNGTTLATTSITGDLSGSEDTIDGINVFKSRVYKWSTSGQSFYYSDVNAFAGDFTEFPINRVAQSGGSIMNMVTITRDGGSGVDDFAAFVMTTGEVIVYQGSNPGDATDFALVGRYQIPAPLAVRGVTQFAGDAKIATRSDFINLLEVMVQGGSVFSPSKLSGAVRAAADAYKDNYGWQVVNYPKSNMLILNVPVKNNQTYHQYVINTITSAACKFEGLNARAFGVVNNRLFFGGSTILYEADTGTSDNGSDISASGQDSFKAFGIPNRKQFMAGRKILRSAAGLNISVGTAVDYGTPNTGSTVSSSASGTQWDVGQWDTFQWADESRAQELLYMVTNEGVTVSTKFNFQVQGDRVEWFRTDYNFNVLTTF